MTRSLATILSAALVASAAGAQEAAVADLQKAREEKRAAPVFQHAKWFFDFDAARAEAHKTGKLIFTYFTRSYVPCKASEALENGPLVDPTFPAFAQHVVLFAHVTSRVAGEPYPNLLREKGFTGYPSLCFMDAEGAVLCHQGERSVAAFELTLTRLLAIRRLEHELAGKDAPELRCRLFLAQLELQLMPAAEIRRRAAELPLPDDQRATVDRFLVDAEVRELRSKQRELGAPAIAAAIADMAKAGREPTDDGVNLFWQQTLTWCSKNGSPELAQRAYDVLERTRLPAAVKKRNVALLEQAKDVARGAAPAGGQ